MCAEQILNPPSQSYRDTRCINCEILAPILIRHHSRCKTIYILKKKKIFRWYSSSKINMTNTQKSLLKDKTTVENHVRGEGRLFHGGKDRSVRPERVAASESPSRILPFRTPIPFLPRSDVSVRVRSIFHLAPVYHSKRSYLPETRPTLAPAAAKSCDIGLSRSDLYYHGTSTLLRSGGCNHARF